MCKSKGVCQGGCHDWKVTLPRQYSAIRTKLETRLKILPSKSSMLFSNLVTDLSANSARVSASFSLSERTLISSSYLSSFCEYCNQKERSRCQATAHPILVSSNTKKVPAQPTDVEHLSGGNGASGIKWHATMRSPFSCLLFYMG